jgi:hypothetical protein
VDIWYAKEDVLCWKLWLRIGACKHTLHSSFLTPPLDMLLGVWVGCVDRDISRGFLSEVVRGHVIIEGGAGVV